MSTILDPAAAPHPNSALSWEGPRGEDPAQPTDLQKVVVTIPAAFFASLRLQCNSKASVSLLGRIHGKHPRLKALTAWAQKTLHPFLTLLSLKTNNVFEVTFDQPEGRTHAPNQADLTCESAAIFFSSWRPYFDASQPHASDRLDHPVWMQVVNLYQVLGDDMFLHTIGEQIGQVISIDNSDAYKAKLFESRIRLFVQDLNALPHTVILPRLDRKARSSMPWSSVGYQTSAGDAIPGNTKCNIVLRKIPQVVINLKGDTQYTKT